MDVKFKYVIVFIIIIGFFGCDENRKDISKLSWGSGDNNSGWSSKNFEKPESSYKSDNKTVAFPKYKGYINDYAKILSAGYIQKITEILKKIEVDNGIQVAVITIETVYIYSDNYKTLREFTANILNDWNIGTKQNNGVVILISEKDEKCLIALGTKYEDSVKSKMESVIKQDMIPHLKKKEYDEGIYAGVNKIIVNLTTATGNTKNEEYNTAGWGTISNTEIADKYQYGISVEGNQIKAFELYKRLADQGDVDSMVELSEYYEDGLWVKRDHRKAINLLKQAADKGSLMAKWQIEFLNFELEFMEIEE